MGKFCGISLSRGNFASVNYAVYFAKLIPKVTVRLRDITEYIQVYVNVFHETAWLMIYRMSAEKTTM